MAAHSRRRPLLGGDRGERLPAAAVRRAHVELRRARQVVVQGHQPVVRDRQSGDRALTVQPGHVTGGDVDGEEAPLTKVGRGDVQRPAVAREGEARHGTVPVAGEGPFVLEPRTVEAGEPDVEPIRLVARPLHRQPGQRVAVRRQHGVTVPGRVRRGQVDRRRATVHRRQMEIEVRRPRLLRAAEPRGEDDRVAAMPEGDLLGAAEGLRRRVLVESPHQVDRFSGGSARVVEFQDEDVRPAAVLPDIPVAHEEVVVGDAGGLPGRPLLEPFRRAVERLALDEHLHRQDDPAAVRRYDQVAHVERKVGHLARLAPGEGKAPDLRTPRARGKEEEIPAVGRPARMEVGRLAGGEPARFRAVEGRDPEVRPAPIRLEIRCPDREGNRRPVRRHPRVGEPLHRQHVVDGERMGLLRRQGPGGKNDRDRQSGWSRRAHGCRSRYRTAEPGRRW